MSTLRANRVQNLEGQGIDVANISEGKVPYVVGSVAELASVPDGLRVDGAAFQTTEFWLGTNVGGVDLIWKADEPTANHNGGTIIDPRRVSSLDPATKTFNDYHTPVVGNFGCFVAKQQSCAIPADVFGAFPSSMQSSWPALQKIIDEGVLATLGPYTYAIDQPLSWESGRGGGFLGSGGTDRYPSTSQDGRLFNGSRLLWIGGASNGAMMLASPTPIGIERDNAFLDSLFGVTLRGLVLDGNNDIDFGLYGYRHQGCLVEDVLATRTNLHGIYITGTYSGTYRKMEAFRCNGSGITWGRGNIDYGFSLAQINAVTIEAQHGHACGLDGAFNEATNPLHGYGVGLFAHRGNFIQGILGENNDGANIVFAPSGYSNTLCQFYSELANSLDIGGGATAISQGRSTQKWGLWVSPIDIGAYNNAVRYGNLSGEFLRIAGTEPSSTRAGEVLEFEQLSGASGSSADWDGWTTRNCASLISSNALGEVPRPVSGTINNQPVIPGLLAVASGAFDATSGAIVATDEQRCTVTYNAAGSYQVSFSKPMKNTNYSVFCNPGSEGRSVVVPVSQKSVNSVRILHVEGTALTDSGAVLSFIVFGAQDA